MFECVVTVQNQPPFATNDLVVLFDPGQSHLSVMEVDVLRHWVAAASMRKNATLMIGGAFETSRSGRLRRLNSLLELLANFGVPGRLITSHEDWNKPSRMGSMNDLPADLVWLQVVETKGPGRTGRQDLPKLQAMRR